MDELFSAIYDRLETLETWALVDWIAFRLQRNGHHPGQEECRDVASTFKIDWDTVVKTCPKFGKWGDNILSVTH